MNRDAVISQCGTYRYLLRREWGLGPIATFIMLNPSTADAETEDPTIRRCIGFAKAWGCRGLQVVNLFAKRATSPKKMMLADDPVGPKNKGFFESAYENARRDDDPGPLICAWGTHGGFMEQDLEVMGWLDGFPAWKPQCLGLTKKMYPKHPLYVPQNAVRVRYHRRRWRPVNGRSVLENPARNTNTA
jgi:hypothetical protein